MYEYAKVWVGVVGPLWLPTATQKLGYLLGAAEERSSCLASDQKNHMAYANSFELQNMRQLANPHEDKEEDTSFWAKWKTNANSHLNGGGL